MNVVTMVDPGAPAARPSTDPHVLDAFQEVLVLSTQQDVQLDDVLRLVGQRLSELLGSTRCSVYLRRSDGVFQGQVGWSTSRTIDESIRKLVSGGAQDRFTGEIVSTAKPVIISDATQDPRTIHRTMRRWAVTSMLGVPLVTEGEVIGVIYVDNERGRREYTEQDVQVAQSFAGLSALVVRQTWQQRRLRDNADVMEQQRTVLTESSLIHSRVTRAVLDDARTEEIIGLLATLLHHHVVLYTPELEVVAWAGPDGTPSGPSPALTREQARTAPVQAALESLRSGEPSFFIHATRELQHRRLMAGLVVDRQCVGYLELREGRGTFNQVHRRAIEQASMALSLRTLTTQRTEALLRRERELFFADLIHGRRDEQNLALNAEAFGVEINRTHLVVVLQYDHRSAGRRLSVLREQGSHIALVNEILAGHSSVLVCTSVHEADLLLIETDAARGDGPEGATEEIVAARLASAHDELRDQLGVQFCVVSDPCTGLAGVGDATRHARQVGKVLRTGHPDSRIVTTRQFGLLRLVAQRTGIAGAVEYAEKVLSPLTTYDAENGTELTRTLSTFVRCDAQLRRTAAELDVHENTVRYRLRKVREISTICPERLESLARVSLALQVGDLMTPEITGEPSPSDTPLVETA